MTVKLQLGSYSKILSQAERILRSGGIVIVPTDTVYGILGDATKAEVIKKIFAIKKRPGEKVFPIFVRDIAAARRYAYISDAKAKFLEKVWPGPITVIFYHKEKLPKILTGGKDTLGIRIPNHFFVKKLLARLDFPLVQTSANFSGLPPAKSMSEVKQYFEKSKINPHTFRGNIKLREKDLRPRGIREGVGIKPDLCIDGGEIGGRQSTVVDFTRKESIILRTGLVSRAELDRLFNNF